MNCVDVNENMVSAVDDRLNGYDRIYFFNHLDKCPSCKSIFLSQQTMKSLLKENIQRKEVPEALFDFVRSLPATAASRSETRSTQGNLNNMVWIVAVAAVFSLTAFYILNLT